MNILPNWMLDMVNKENQDLKELFTTLENAGVDVESDRKYFSETGASVKSQIDYLHKKYSEYFI